MYLIFTGSAIMSVLLFIMNMLFYYWSESIISGALLVVEKIQLTSYSLI